MGEMIVRYMMEPGANLSWRFGVLMASLHLAFASFMTSRVYRGSDSKLGFWLHYPFPGAVNGSEHWSRRSFGAASARLRIICC
jgi:hypothetical protein